MIKSNVLQCRTKTEAWFHAVFLFGVAVLISGCVSRYDIPRELQFQTTILAEPISSESPEIVNIVYVHGMGCHDPGYSTPMQYRLLDKLNQTTGSSFVRSPRQMRSGVRFFDYYEFEDPLELKKFPLMRPPQRFLSVKERHAVSDPTDFTLFERPWLNHIIPTSSGRKKSYERKLQAVLNPQESNNPSDLTGFSAFTDFCYERNKGKAKKLAAKTGSLAPLNMELGPGVLIREFEDQSSKRRVRFIEVLWSPVSERLKLNLLGYDFYNPPAKLPPIQGLENNSGTDELVTNWNERALINRYVKDTVLNAGFPDAVFYVGRGRSTVLAVVESALCFGFMDEPGMATARLQGGKCPLDKSRDKSSVEFMAESLGSRILFDSLSNFILAQNERTGTNLNPFSSINSETNRIGWELTGRVEGDRSRSPSIFLFANQLPLLEVGIGNGLPHNYLDESVLDRMIAGDLFTTRPQSASGADYFTSFDSADFAERCVFGLYEHKLALQSAGFRPEKLDPDEITAELNPDNITFLHEDLLSGIRRNELRLATRAICEQAMRDVSKEMSDAWDDLPDSDPSTPVIEKKRPPFSDFDLSFKAIALWELSKNLLDSGPHTLDDALEQIALIKLEQNIRGILEDSKCATSSVLRDPEIEKAVPDPENDKAFPNPEFKYYPLEVQEWTGRCNDRFIEAMDKIYDEKLQILAFSDANDFLTYEIKNSFSEQFNFMNFENIPIRIETPIIPTDGVAGLFVNPAGAHTNYRFSVQTVNWLVCGASKCQ